jgi:hypothetical protein
MEGKVRNNNPKIGLPIFKEEKRRFIRANEIFALFMACFGHPKSKDIITAFVKKDRRRLSELSVWLLKSRGFSSLTETKE